MNRKLDAVFLHLFRQITFTALLILFSNSVAGAAAEGVVKEQKPRNPDWATPVTLEGAPNLHKINDNLYRSAQPTAAGIRNLEKMGIKTIINLREFHNDKDEAKGTGVKRIDIPLSAGSIKDEEVVLALKQLGNKSGGPYLIHCLHGADRTGVVSAMYRMVYENWDRNKAIDELRNGGYGFHEIWVNIIRYLEKVDVQAIKLAISR